MSDRECVALLQWALPRLGLRWEGFRTLRGQVCKRIARRVKALRLEGLSAYRQRLEADPAEWAHFDALCRVTITRFYRDRAVFDALRDAVLPELARAAVARGAPALRVFSAGCASGEEPYTVALVYAFAVAPRFPGLGIEVLASDSDPVLLERARVGIYPRGALRELPADWSSRAFISAEAGMRLLPELRAQVTFRPEDVRQSMPEGPFDLVLCRNLAFTYFGPELQRRTLAALVERLVTGGALVIGGHEVLPEGGPPLERRGHLPVYRKP